MAALMASPRVRSRASRNVVLGAAESGFHPESVSRTSCNERRSSHGILAPILSSAEKRLHCYTGPSNGGVACVICTKGSRYPSQSLFAYSLPELKQA